MSLLLVRGATGGLHRNNQHKVSTFRITTDTVCTQKNTHTHKNIDPRKETHSDVDAAKGLLCSGGFFTPSAESGAGGGALRRAVPVPLSGREEVERGRPLLVVLPSDTLSRG